MQKVAVLLAEGFADWEYALIGGTGGPFYGLEIQYVTLGAAQLTSQGGMQVRVAKTRADMAEMQPGVIVVIGGMIWETDRAPDITDMLRQHHQSGGTVAGICGGTLALARAGLLDDHAHTSNDAAFLPAHAPGYKGQGRYQAQAAAIQDGRVITAPGTAPVSFTAEVFRTAGLGAEPAAQFKAMLAAEHQFAEPA
ncbi:DJ-1/PfpI family protein [Sulfitobacter mediterraneus]|uniref:Thiamine biosynthesis protein ThiJ n=1 Tax=Sulfitobacter mediterraneus TaxID=83219 RepID=A0A061SUW6_9RHOB|nr:DJ-1/PfpI family protein [Sulfitobacter mediterraneus]KAJ03135.1 thiamine biosynthesis protein ThiJ [Sulfitobacter mediterraneus]